MPALGAQERGIVDSRAGCLTSPLRVKRAMRLCGGRSGQSTAPAAASSSIWRHSAGGLASRSGRHAWTCAAASMGSAQSLPSQT